MYVIYGYHSGNTGLITEYSVTTSSVSVWVATIDPLKYFKGSMAATVDDVMGFVIAGKLESACQISSL